MTFTSPGMPATLNQLAPDEEYDVVVLGAGGAGMSAALFSAIAGARVLLVESTEYVGGTTAWSAATTWIPGTHLAAQVNREDSIEQAATFLDHAVGGHSPRDLRQSLLAHGAEAVAVLEANSDVRYRVRPFHPDYLSELEGSTLCGRALEPLPFDGRQLGELLTLVRPTIPEFTVLGGMMVDRDDIAHLLGWKKSLRSVAYVARILARHVSDRMAYPRSTRLLMGNALVGRLLLSLQKRGVTLLMNTSATELHRGGDGVTEVDLAQNGLKRRVRAKGGVILGTGGFNRDPERRQALLPGVDLRWCPGAPGHTGTAHALAEKVGACYGGGAMSNAFWAPVSVRKRADGSTAVFPHFVFDRAKPGMLTVDGEGRRFVNESTSYHLFGIAMQEAHRTRPAVPSFLVTDAEGMRKYGLGMVRPGGMGLKGALADGYVTSAPTIKALARELDLPGDEFERTVATFNTYWQSGVDPEFGRGTTAYQRANGDAKWPGPNPSLGPVQKPPFYAVKLFPGDIGAATGFMTDASARALDRNGHVIPGLYAVGNDMQSAMGGVYPAPGITIGPGLVFAFVAARDAVARARGAPAVQPEALARKRRSSEPLGEPATLRTS